MTKKQICTKADPPTLESKAKAASAPAAAKKSGKQVQKKPSKMVLPQTGGEAAEAANVQGLPDGWKVVSKVRNKRNKKDSHYYLYYPPGGGKPFDSLKKVRQHLNQ